MATINNKFTPITFKTMDAAVRDYFAIKYPLIIDGRKVPVVFATPERWAQVQRDAYLRDEKGNLLLPAIAIRRGSPEINRSRYVPKRPETDVLVKVPAQNPDGTMKMFKKNQPVYDIYSIPYPRFINMNYTVVIWASYWVDINEIQQRYLWEGIDHVFTKDKYWFTGTIQGINELTNTEDNTRQERIQKVEYSLTLEGYISDSKSMKHMQNVNEIKLDFFTDAPTSQNAYHFSDPPASPPVRS